MKKIHTIILLLAAILCLGMTAATASAGGHRHQPTVQLAFLPPPPFLAPFFYGRDRDYYRYYDPPRRYYRDRHHRRHHRHWRRHHRGDRWSPRYHHWGDRRYWTKTEMTGDTVTAIETVTAVETATDIETGHGDEGTGVNREKDRAACLCFSQGEILMMCFLQGTNRYTRRKFYELASCEAFLLAYNLGVKRRSP